jgi:DNA-binding NarL/FixJ family response regulator
MPNLDGIAATATIRQSIPDTEVLVLTSVLEGSTVSRAIEAGAIGYLLKNARAKELCQAIKAAAAHQVQLSPQAAVLLVRQTKTPSTIFELSKREKDVLELVAKGLSNKEVATKLQLAENTVKTHVSSILTKLGVQSRTQAILHAVRLGLIPPVPPQT